MAVLVTSFILGFTGSVVAHAATATLVNLGTAGDFAVLSKTAISSTGSTVIVGDIGVSPTTDTAITGFSLIGVPANDLFLTSAQLPGYKVYSANLQSPTPSNMTTAISDMELAYTAATGGANVPGTGPFLNIGAGTVSTQTLVPGVYTWGSNVNITGDITLDCQGNANAVFVFQISGNLDLATGKQIILNGCQASNVFWAVAGTTFLQASSHFEGTILAGPATSEITLIGGVAGATINGRLLGEKTIALQAATSVTKPAATGPVFIDANLNGVLDQGESFFNTIQAAITAATSSDTIHVTAGTYTEVGQIVVDKNLSIVGANKATTFIKPAQDTTNTSHADSAAWILVNSGKTLNLSNFTLNGSGKLIAVGILSHGHGTINNNIFTNIAYNQSGPDYKGIAVELYGSDMTVSNNSFNNIGRIGIYNGFGTVSTISGNTYTGKGAGNWLDYAFEVGRNGQAAISSSTISENLGVATVDNSTSAGILVTSYYNPETPSGATLTNNTVSSSTDGIVVGYDGSDASVVVAHNNNLSGNIAKGMVSTNPAVNAENNWWGTGDKTAITLLISGAVDFDPWCGNSTCSVPDNSGPEVTKTLESSVSEMATTSAGSVQVDMATSTEITGPNTWDGTFNTTPTETSNFTLTANSGFTASAVSSIEVGTLNVQLTLSSAVRLLFAGQTDNLVGYSRSGVFTPITAVCVDDTQATNDATLTAGADCKITSGADLVVWTKHFTVFTTYTQSAIPASAPSSNGGGGGGPGPVGAIATGWIATTPIAPTVAIGQAVAGQALVGQVLGVSIFNFTNDLSVGARGNGVIELQNRLTKEGVYSGPVTGYFGSLTLAGVKAYQVRQGIPQAGMVNSLTRNQLNNSQVAGASTVNAEAVKAQVASLRTQLESLLQQLVLILQNQVNRYK